MKESATTRPGKSVPCTYSLSATGATFTATGESGSSGISYTVEANRGAARSATVTTAGLSYTVAQQKAFTNNGRKTDALRLNSGRRASRNNPLSRSGKGVSLLIYEFQMVDHGLSLFYDSSMQCPGLST
jgi:hypothetical protein